MKKGVVLLLFIILLSSNCFALTVPTTYKNTRVKFYSNDINESWAYSNLDKIPEKYLEGINIISFFPQPRGSHYGFYFYGKRSIYVMGEPELKIITHELAHHQQYINKEPFREIKQHTGNFSKYYEEITEAVNIKCLLEIKKQQNINYNLLLDWL